MQSKIKDVVDKVIYSLEAKFNAQASKSPHITFEADEMSRRYSVSIALSCLYKRDDFVSFESEVDSTSVLLETATKNFVSPFFKFCMMFPIVNPIVSQLAMLVHPMGMLRKTILGYTYQQLMERPQNKPEIERTNMIPEQFGSGESLGSRDADKSRRGLMSCLNERFRAGKLTQSEYSRNSIALFVATTKTTSDTVSKLLYNLAYHQDEQDKLRASIHLDGIESEYLLWTIYETMRLFPPVPAGSSRVISYDLVTRDGILIPAGTFVYTPANIIHRWPQYWGQDANEFRPERWRHSNSFHPVQFLAFGAGRRKCPGGEFGLTAIKMLASELLTRYKFECMPGTDAESIMQFDTYIVMTCTEAPVNLKVTRLA